MTDTSHPATNPHWTIEASTPHAVVTKLHARCSVPYGVQQLYDDGSWRGCGRSFATLTEAEAFLSTLPTNPLSAEKPQPTGLGERIIAPSVYELAHIDAALVQQGKSACPRCRQMGSELLTSAQGLLCPTCYDEVGAE